MKIKQNKVVFRVYKALTDCGMQYVNNMITYESFQLQQFITSSVALDKTLAVPVITLVLTADWDQ